MWMKYAYNTSLCVYTAGFYIITGLRILRKSCSMNIELTKDTVFRNYQIGFSLWQTTGFSEPCLDCFCVTHKLDFISGPL